MDRLNNSPKREWERLFMIRKLILDLLYPPVCLVCGRLLERCTGLCPDCMKRLRWIESPRCMCCGKPLLDERREYCRDCEGTQRGFDAGIGVFPYRSNIRKAVLELKNDGKKENAAFLGACMAASLGPLLSFWRPQCLVPVPLDPKKLRARGYNQAKLLADSAGRRLDIPVRSDILYRSYAKKEQKGLRRFARKRSQAGAFYVKKTEVPKRILLVDDIYTTGNTLEAAAHALKGAGAEKIFFVTVCMGTDF